MNRIIYSRFREFQMVLFLSAPASLRELFRILFFFTSPCGPVSGPFILSLTRV